MKKEEIVDFAEYPIDKLWFDPETTMGYRIVITGLDRMLTLRHDISVKKFYYLQDRTQFLKTFGCIFMVDNGFLYRILTTDNYSRYISTPSEAIILQIHKILRDDPEMSVKMALTMLKM